MRASLFILLTGIVLLGFIPFSYAAKQDFHVWLKELKRDALEYGISQKLIDEALPETIVPNERVVRLDKKQPEHHITFERYKKNVVTPGRVRDGRKYMQEYHSLLEEISREYGVDPEYIVALWGVETSFGRNIGGFETIPALMTLAYDGRRADFFRKELLQALKIVDQGDVGLHEMKGSWAGAMGQCQFMPSSFDSFAQDYNKDGKRDIWNTRADVFASTAAYLSKSGWQKGQPFGHVVKLPKSFNKKLIDFKAQKPVQFWKDAGVRLASGKEIPEDPTVLASILQPGGEGYKVYIVYNNYRILMKWNYSSYFATAVALFAEQLK